TVACALAEGSSIGVGKARPVRVPYTTLFRAPEDITVTISGPSGVLGTKTCTAVPANGTCELIITQSCTVAGSTQYTVDASATNDWSRGPHDCNPLPDHTRMPASALKARLD